MAPTWGCCTGEDTDNLEQFIKCSRCNKAFHFLCLSIPEIQSDSDTYNKWKCPGCMSSIPKSGKHDSTPIRNVSTTRGSKRPALNSPPKTSAITPEDIRNIVQDVVKSEFVTMMQEINKSIINIIDKKLEPILSDVHELKESLNFHTREFEEFRSEQVTAINGIKTLRQENVQLKTTVSDLNQRLNYLEQQARSNNIEIQCLPENKQENLYTVVKQLGSVVGNDLKDSDILHCSRIAKLNYNTNTRPRSIVVQLASPRIRDHLLAAVIDHNKKNVNNKLNTADFGLACNKSPVYVVEHLSPANKALHAATRLKARERSYKYVWVRSGRIFVKKNDDAETIIIKNLDTLNKLV